jgi:DNA-binding transcriptional LysR family regulator
METDVLRWFQQVADGVTVTEVADLAMVSQPAVSRALARLEDEIGTPLLQRSGRVLRLTQAGASFKRHADSLINALDDGLAAVGEVLDPETGTVTLSFQLSLGTWLVPHLVRRFLVEHPRVQFRLRRAEDAWGDSLVARGLVDMELTSRRPETDLVTWQPLFTETLYLAVPPGHRLAQLDEVPLADAADERFVVMRPPWQLREISDRLCGAAGFVPTTVFESDDLSTVRGFVAAGLGVAILPAMDANPASPMPGEPWLVRLTDDGAWRHIGLVGSPARRLLPAAERFWDFLLTQQLAPH